MGINPKHVQSPLFWLFFLLMACPPLVLLAAETGAPSVSARDFPFTEPQFERISEVEMLDNEIITSLAQDTRGLIWIGTQNGLVRYDGYRFRKFIHKTGDPFSLAGNYVYALLAASDGRLWVGTRSDGLSIFDPATERFANFRHNANDPGSLGGGMIWAFAEDARGGMWITSDQGLNHMPHFGTQFVHFRHGTDPHSLMDDKVRSLSWDKGGQLWVGGISGLQRMAKDGKSFETILTDMNVQALFQAQDGKLWIGTRKQGVAWLMPNPAQPGAMAAHWLPLQQLSYPWITGIIQARKDQIWLATFGGGVTVVTASDGQVLHTLRHDPTRPGSLAFDTTKPLLLDRAGLLWVGTAGAGLQRMNTNTTMLRSLLHSQQQANSLSHPNTTAILELQNGLLLFGSSGNGIDVFDRQRGLVGSYRSGALPDASISALAQTIDGTLWAGTRNAGVVRQFAGSTTWVEVSGLPDLLIYQLLACHDGSLWASTVRGVARWRPGSSPGQAARFEVLKDAQGTPMQNMSYALAEDRQGRVWIGTNSGLWVHLPNQDGLMVIHADPNRADGLISDDITGLLVDSHDRLWVATHKGLERLQSWDGKQARFEHVNTLLGQPETNLGKKLLEDRAGRIWTEEVMIDRITNDPATMRMTSHAKAEGMNLGTGWGSSYGKTRDGLLLYGGANGVAIIDPTQFRAYDYAPSLIVSELKINGETMPPGRLAMPESGTGPIPALDLSPEERNFSIEFAALDYSEPKKNRYQYRLQGYDKPWINADSEHRNAAYGNLWPGLYTLQVRGSNRMGAWSPHELLIPIRVLPAWWQTWWFAGLLLLTMLALIFGLVQGRTRYLRQRQRALEHLVHERTDDLRQKQSELFNANLELNESNAALNNANANLVLSVDTLRQLGDIGREITANLDAEIVFQSLYLYVGGLLEAPAMTIYRMNTAGTILEIVFGRDDDKATPIGNVPLDSPNSNAARAVRERQELLLHYELPGEAPDLPGTRPMLTALFAPLIVDDRVLGAMSIQSDRENAYGERERLIFRTITAYGAIALANAGAVAALHQAQGQLVQQEKMASLGGLVAGIAHQINTPLGTTLVAISGVEAVWQTLQNAVAGGSLSRSVLESSTTEGMEYTALALKTATRAAELIALFKTISVNEDSDRPMAVELADYLQEMATLVSNKLAQNGCKLEVAAPAGLSIHIVPEALTEPLSRILVNALDHGFAEGRTGTLRLCAQVGASDGDDEVIITVSDDGHGIAPEDLPKVFDPFFTTKSGMHGHVGLGLHVAYNHVTQRLKGQIHITSTQGEGTSVEIRLKKHPGAEPAAKAAESVLAKSGGT